MSYKKPNSLRPETYRADDSKVGRPAFSKSFRRSGPNRSGANFLKYRLLFPPRSRFSGAAGPASPYFPKP